MRSDYILYTIAIIFFIITGIIVVKVETQRNLWIVTTIVLGLFFIGIGYTQRPKRHAITAEAPPPQPPPPPAPPPITKAVEEKGEIPIEALPKTKMEITKVKGIGEKRAEQLKALGISGVEDLAKASAQDLAVKLKISPKITGRWIENAKMLIEGSEKV
ncbi:MAG: helix-hairpin-helix domain-containing protein [Candidatus Bathyarchaeia archaeon]